MDKENQNDKLEDNLSGDEFEEIYGEEDYTLDETEEGVSDQDLASDVNEGRDLDFIEEDMEEIYPEENSFEEDVYEQAYSEPDITENELPQKRKSSFTTISLIILVVFLAGVGAYFAGVIPNTGTLSSTSVQKSGDDQVEGTTNITAPPDVAREDTSSGETEGTHQEELANLYDGPEGTDDTGFASVEEESEDMFANLEENTSQQQSAAGADLPSQQNPSMQQENTFESQLMRFEDRMNEIQRNLNNRLNEIETQVDAGVPVEGNAQGAAVDNEVADQLNTDISEIKDTLERLTSRLDEIEENVAGLSNKIESSATAVSKSEPEPASKPVAKAKPAPAATTPKAPSVSASTWEIRAIQVGKAVIAKKGTGETRNITVGDSVPGLGTIKDINYKNGGWVIEGSGGRIKQ